VYLREHRHAGNRALHLLAKLLMLGAVALAVGLRSFWPLLAVPVVGVVPCWLGHLFLEGNRPTSWSRPADSVLGSLRLAARPDGGKRGRFYYSFFADLRMCAQWVGSLFRSSERT
jgi:hypothetical protein